LDQGLHTFEVRGVDAQGDVDTDPASRQWFVDTVAPTVTIDPPASPLAEASPTLGGSSGTAFGDLPSVITRIRDSGGALIQSLTASPAGSGWSAKAAPLADGTYTAQAEQPDAAGNVGSSAVVTFTIDTPDPPPPLPPDPPSPPDPDPAAPTFVLAPAEERLADALAGRLTVVAGCASACRVSARITASPRASRNLGLGRKTTDLGRGTKQLARAGTAATAMRLTKRARAALRGEDSTTATLRVTVVQGSDKLSLSRTISLLRSAGLKRIASRGLRLWAICSESCPLLGKLTLSARSARRIGLKPSGSARTRVASGRATAAANRPIRLTLTVRRGAREALRKAKRVSALLEAVAGPPSLSRTATRGMTLRR
jgi:hypothetical protein